ncbi:hypothetical protein KVR01_010944 [Diaporthe batatas]|uniref:uncharacterized protein n=1 Tax=Diaporthe batatas TaxID=748121 RepID=UPI001D059FD8|nr:uncharacterized protein KVR01_010944 [Diaporthe batatas]KAG8159283.1 hypothetical protein KVR01_010944 [Diaporthe batatas]
MEHLLGLVFACCSITVAQAAIFRWDSNDARRWSPAKETLGVMPLLGMSPMPTSPPEIGEAKEHKRAGQDNTCAYVDGDPDIPLYCNVGSACVYNSVRSNIGCCPDTSTTCSIWTTCLDSSDKSLFTTDNGYTLWCGSSDYPYCRTHLYEDDVFTGYTLLGCGVAAGTDSVVYSPTLSGPSSAPSTSSTSTSVSSTSASSTSRLSTTGSTTTSNNPTTPPAPNSTNSPASIGAIVGGAVGGVAVIALFALVLVLLLRRRRHHHHHQGPANDPYGPIMSPGGNPSQQPPSQPEMQQPFQPPHLQPVPSSAGYAATAPGADNRSSIAKPSPVSTAQHIYTSTAAGSPPPPSQSPGIIPPAYQATNTNVGPAPTTLSVSPTVLDGPQQQIPESHANPGHHVPVQPAYYQHEGGHYFEMPTVKSDRELRELA